ncbi:MAG: LytR C-terminal domain-containing protein [bacterium]
MDKKTKSRILSITLITILSVVILVFVVSIVFKFTSKPKADSESEENLGKMTNNEMIQVSVLNGCGVKGLAGKVRDYLREKGFDVVDVGNVKKQTDFSFVIDRIGDTTSSLKLAKALGLPESKIVYEMDSSMFLRSSIVIGSDYKKLKPFK